MLRRRLLIAMCGLVLTGCGGGHDEDHTRAQAKSFDARGDRDLIDTNASIEGERAGKTYERWAAERDVRSTKSYAGYGCTEDCSGHEAGYRWAADHGVSDESECSGKSWSFEEGCAAFVQGLGEDEPAEADEQESRAPDVE